MIRKIFNPRLLLLPLFAVFVIAAGPATGPSASSPPVFPLWAGDAPGALGHGENDIPTLTLYAADPAIATHSAILVCPGGAYVKFGPQEGVPVCQWLNRLGITAGLLKYRLGSHGYHYPAEFLDVQRAFRMMRANAATWHFDANHVGVIGFSAGGHLASTLATHFDAGNPSAADPIERVSSRPDVALLLYPVITMGDLTHKGSQRALLGEHPDPKLIELLSNEKHVTPQTPPCFICATADDTTVPVQNSLMFAMACKENKVPFELHIFEHGKHGFGLGGKDPSLSTWPADAARFLARQGFLNRRSIAK